IDGVTNQVIAQVPVGDGPCALVYNYLNNSVYCANVNNNRITVIDGLTNGVVTTVIVGSGPYALSWDSLNNRVYCVNCGGDNVTIIDGRTNTVIRTIPTGMRPQYVTWNPLQNRTYVANCLSSNVSVIRDSMTAIEESADLRCRIPDARLRILQNPTTTKQGVRLLATCRSPNGRLQIYDVAGKLVRSFTITNNHSPITLLWNVCEEHGASLPEGIYFIRLNDGSLSVTKKAVVLE
ncbi:T9SS type A sorting domain-containing protein, partial [Candidatus Bathyarchaeota archaeon]|nr:T9SS type A sorting domain-containing protein [Candidatus Bathyarchaeota archaeon]